jgi:hypothetical protein
VLVMQESGTEPVAEDSFGADDADWAIYRKIVGVASSRGSFLLNIHPEHASRLIRRGRRPAQPPGRRGKAAGP